ncbi:MAG: response regulator [Deltaproteobacteria bacterium]|nr:response regulator [Deltaproteobacteria bacterium]
MKNGKHVILCVDDDNDILETLKVVLEANRYVVVTAGTAEAGYKIWQTEKPDLVFVDLMMEEVDAGTSLVMRLKAAGNVAPVFLLSSVGEQLNRNIDYNQLGLAGVFQKPIDSKALLGTVQRHLK